MAKASKLQEKGYIKAKQYPTKELAEKYANLLHGKTEIVKEQNGSKTIFTVYVNDTISEEKQQQETPLQYNQQLRKFCKEKNIVLAKYTTVEMEKAIEAYKKHE